VDVKAARKAGCACAAVTWGYSNRTALEKERPDFLVDTPEQLLAIAGVSP